MLTRRPRGASATCTCACACAWTCTWACCPFILRCIRVHPASSCLCDAQDAVRAKLQRLHSSQRRVLTWRCWSTEQRALLRSLHAEQWRTLPPLRAAASTILMSLAQPTSYDTLHANTFSAMRAPPSVGSPTSQQKCCTPLGLLIHVLHAATTTLPAIAAPAVALAGVRLLRHASRVRNCLRRSQNIVRAKHTVRSSHILPSPAVAAFCMAGTR